MRMIMQSHLRNTYFFANDSDLCHNNDVSDDVYESVTTCGYETYHRSTPSQKFSNVDMYEYSFSNLDGSHFKKNL